jgi:signal peptidase I
MEWRKSYNWFITLIIIVSLTSIFFYTKYKDILEENKNLQKQIDELRIDYQSTSIQITNKETALQLYKNIFCNITSKVNTEFILYNDSSLIFNDGRLHTNVGFNGMSMYPTLKDGDYFLEYSPKSINELKVGDIITYNTKTVGYFTHRIIGFYIDQSKVYIITKGDSNPEPDPFKTSFEDVRGIVAVIFPQVKILSQPMISDDWSHSMLKYSATVDKSAFDCVIHPT